MIRVLFLFVVLLMKIPAMAQYSGIQPDDPAFIARYAGFDFKGKFAAAIDKDEANNYFLLDFSKLPTRFERVYFMNLSFSSEQLVNIDPDIAKDRVCFMTSKKYSETEILQLFDEIRVKTNDTAGKWPEGQKSDWLKEKDKYK